MPDTPGVSSPITSRLELRPAGLDHWGVIRDLHQSSFRRLSAPWLGQSESDVLGARLHEPGYTHAMQACDLTTAWLDDHLLGTAGWVPFEGGGDVARITGVTVSPFFTRLGIGRRLVAAAEARAAIKGFRRFATRALPGAVPFFEAIGYLPARPGLVGTGLGEVFPVILMRKGARFGPSG